MPAPRYTLAAWPAARIRNVPIVHWNANAATDKAFEVWPAHRAANRIVTATPESYKYIDYKVTVIGQGIDFARFIPGAGPRSGARKIINTDRLTPIKNIKAAGCGGQFASVQAGLR